jgi:hypothetical protein
MWVEEMAAFKETVEEFQADDNEINKIAEETGRVIVNREHK